MTEETALDSFIDKFGGWTEAYSFYNGEVELRYDPKEHVYLLVNGDNLEVQDGVTTVVHVIDKSEALIPWGCKMMGTKLLATVPVVTLPTGDRIVPQQTFDDFAKIVQDAKSAHKEKLEEAAAVGSIAHNWIEQSIKREMHSRQYEGGMWESVPWPADERAKNCCLAAIDWMNKHKVHWLSTERKIYSRKHRYAGTMDGLAYVSSCDDPMCCEHKFESRLSIIDWKSSNYLYLEYLYQTAAYENAYEEETGDDVLDRWVIRLGKDDGEFEPWHCVAEEFAEDIKGFLLCLELRRSVASVKKRIQEKQDTIRRERKARDLAEKERVKQEQAEIKKANKAKAKAEKEAALKVKCKGADKYKAVRAPKCNKGVPCETCLAKFAEKYKR